jgi:hypothetical protein
VPRRKTSKKKKATRRKAVRPIKYGAGVAGEILARLAAGKETLTAILHDDHMPSMATVLNWVGENEEFREAYHVARLAKAEMYADQAIEISDDGSADFVLREKGEGEVEIVIDREAIQRSHLRVATRKWAASKLAPKQYGDRTALDVGGQDGDNPLTFAELAKRATA